MPRARQRRRRPARAAATLGVLASLAGLVAAPAPAPGTGRERPAVPAPDLAGVDPLVREQLEAARRSTLDLLAASNASATALAESFGELGRLYFVYTLMHSAERCFDAAARLAPGDFRWHYYLGVIHQGGGRFDRAAERLDRALAARPRDLAALLRAGAVEVGRGRPEAAVGFFTRALEVDPGSAAALFGLGQVAHARGDLERAAELFEAVVASQPEATTAHYQLGLVYRRAGDLERARVHLSRQGRGEVWFPDPLVNELAGLARGAAARVAQATRASSRGDLETAAETLAAALAVDPDNVDVRLALASNLIRQGRTERALSELEEVLARDPDNAAAHYNLGTVLSRTGREQEALVHLERACRLVPDFADAHANQAAVLHRLARYEEAVAAYALALELRPDDRQLAVRRAEALHRLGRGEEAAAALDAVAAEAGADAELLLALGRAFEAGAEPDRAIASYRAALAPGGPPEAAAPAARQLASLLVSRGRETEARAALDTALELRPDWPEALLDRAVVHGRLGSYDDAAADFGRAVRLRPRDEAPRMGLTVALLLGERYREAADHLEESVSALPDSLGLRHALARLLAACPDDAIRDGARALELAREVVGRQRNIEHGQTMAMALAEVGRFEEAAALQGQLVRAAQPTAPAPVLAEMRERLARFERGEPVRAPWLP